jgi:hypothetical protein
MEIIVSIHLHNHGRRTLRNVIGRKHLARTCYTASCSLVFVLLHVQLIATTHTTQPDTCSQESNRRKTPRICIFQVRISAPPTTSRRTSRWRKRIVRFFLLSYFRSTADALYLWTDMVQPKVIDHSEPAGRQLSKRSTNTLTAVLVFTGKAVCFMILISPSSPPTTKSYVVAACAYAGTIAFSNTSNLTTAIIFIHTRRFIRGCILSRLCISTRCTATILVPPFRADGVE